MPMPSTSFPRALLLVAALVGACAESDENTEPDKVAAPPPETTSPSPQEPETAEVVYRDVAWEDLIPGEDLDALLNPPEYLDTIAEGSAGDRIPGELESPERTGAESRYQQALTSTRIKPEYDRQSVRIPGFVVPLAFDEEQTITRFLLVPYFGACIHLPPPPPNQVIYADFPQGFQVEFLYDPFHVEGQLRTLPKDTEQGTAAYTMEVKRIYPYEE